MENKVMEFSDFYKGLKNVVGREDDRVLILIEVDDDRGGVYNIDVIKSSLSLEEYCYKVFNSIVEEWDEEGEGYSLNKEEDVKIFSGFGVGKIYVGGELYMEIYERIVDY